MGARTRLNQAYFNGSVAAAGLIGLLSESWPAFFLTLAVLTASNLYLREIRPGRHPRGRDRQRPH